MPDLLHIDWNPLLCQIAALRYELRANSFAQLASTETRPAHRDQYEQLRELAIAAADRVAKGGSADE